MKDLNFSRATLSGSVTSEVISPVFEAGFQKPMTDPTLKTLHEEEQLPMLRLIKPTAFPVNSKWGPRKIFRKSDTYDPKDGKPFHKGWDFKCPIGSDVAACADGEVVFSGWYNNVSGKTVIVRHNKHLTTSYVHLDAPLVKKGDKVKQGDVIAKSGNTGNSTGPHLHLTIRYDGVEVDPAGFFSE